MTELTDTTAPKKKPLTNKELQKNVNAMSEQLDDVTEAVNQLGEGQVSIDTKLENLINTFQSATNAAVAPKRFEPMEQDMGTERAATEAAIDPAGDAVLVDQGLHDVDSPEFTDKMDLLAFMEEPVGVFIHETSEKDADMVFDIQVNGKAHVFRRGQTLVVRRKFIEGLARAKPVHYDNVEFVQKDGTNNVRWPGRRGLRYPFTVMEEHNPRGKAWLTAILAQP